MPWMQRITWSGIAMHAGVVPGYPASHGCIRLPFAFAPQMFALTKMGARVVVASRDTEPFAISHPLLPLPKMQPAPAAQQQAAAPRDPSIELASADTTKSTMTTAAVDEEAPPPMPTSCSIHCLCRYTQAAPSPNETLADLAAKDALAAAQTAGAEARQAVDDVRKAEADLATAEAKVAALEKVIAAPAPAAAPAAAGTPDTTGSVEADRRRRKPSWSEPVAHATKRTRGCQIDGRVRRRRDLEARRRDGRGRRHAHRPGRPPARAGVGVHLAQGRSASSSARTGRKCGTRRSPSEIPTVRSARTSSLPWTSSRMDRRCNGPPSPFPPRAARLPSSLAATRDRTRAPARTRRRRRQLRRRNRRRSARPSRIARGGS